MQLEAVTKVYAMGEVAVPALTEVSLAIDAGELVAIMGPSGSGKSTLMNIIGCLDRPTSGRYLLAGSDVSHLDRNDLAAVRNHFLGFVFQSFNLLPRTTALENVELPLLYAGIAARARQQLAKDALARVGLGGRLEHVPSQMSGGEQQRVAIARALVAGPQLILADEPTGNLDSRTSIEVMALLQQLNRAHITIVAVTHEPDIAAFAQRVITMVDGRVRSDVRQHAQQAEVELAAVQSPRDAAPEGEAVGNPAEASSETPP